MSTPQTPISRAIAPHRFHLDYHFHQLTTAEVWPDFAQGLDRYPKTISSVYLYDRQGSALFEQICELPEYYPTRTEAQILLCHGAEIANLTGVCEFVELGSGSSTKTRILLDAYHQAHHPIAYMPVDVSASILETSAPQLLADYPQLTIHGLVATYEQAFGVLAQTPAAGQRLVMFLGSTLGNFSPQDCDRFFGQLRQALNPGDYFLLGIDLQKSPAIIEPAYNDHQGITAAFNRNLLNHVNQKFQGNFDPEAFTHRAIYNQDQGQIEMYLDCDRPHTVTFAAGENRSWDLAAGESILTEISRKFDLNTMETYLQNQGLPPVKSWTDDQQWFGLILAQV